MIDIPGPGNSGMGNRQLSVVDYAMRENYHENYHEITFNDLAERATSNHAFMWYVEKYQELDAAGQKPRIFYSPRDGFMVQDGLKDPPR